MEIEVQLKKVYGNEWFYPVNDFAKMLCKLMKRQSLTKDQLRMCQKEHGCNVVVKMEEYVLD